MMKIIESLIKGIIFIIGLKYFAWSANGKQLVALDNVNISTNGTQQADWSVDNIIDGRIGDAESCDCCATIERPAWLQKDLRRPYFLETIEIFGRFDGFLWQIQNETVELRLSPEEFASFMLTHNGTNEIQLTLKPYEAVQFIRIAGSYLSTNHTLMTLCEIKLYQQTESNIITPNMSTNQSNTFANCNSKNAIDGIFGLPDFSDELLCRTCSAMFGNGQYPWWRVDIGEKMLGHSVRVHGRTVYQYQSADLQVFISNVTDDFINGTFVGHIAESGIKNGALLFFNRHIFQYLTILRRTYPLMILCEVDIYHAECTSGHYGMLCLPCSHCKDTLCDAMSGHCTHGCLPGWTTSTCNAECAFGHFGWLCQPCSNCKNSECDAMTGECTHGCEPGWRTAICNITCDDGRYGLNCSQSCGQNCADTGPCNKMNGTCIGGCRPGYDYQKDSFCNLACEQGFFGLNCTSQCHCKEGLHCDHVSGMCSVSRCEPGWTGDNCSIPTHTETTTQEPNTPLSATSFSQDKYIKLLLIIIAVISTVLGLVIATFLLLFFILRARMMKGGPSTNSEGSTPPNQTSTTTHEYDTLSSTQMPENYEQLQLRTGAFT